MRFSNGSCNKNINTFCISHSFTSEEPSESIASYQMLLVDGESWARLVDPTLRFLMNLRSEFESNTVNYT